MPSPTITWFKNNTIWVPNTRRINMPNNNTIVFDQLKKEDENIYGCMAQNRYGEDFRSSNLIIGEVGENVFLFWIIILVVCLIIILGIYLAILSAKLYYDKKTRSELKAIVIYNKNNDTSNGMHSNSSNSERTNLLTFCNKWEFSRENLKLQEMLGTGSFGCVMKAKAFGINPEEESTTVAVKMVKRNPHIMHIKALISELKIMMHLGEHNNIVNLLGACTNDLITNRELYVLVEYCLYGNLKKYLQQYRGNYVDQIAVKDTECKTENNKIFLSKQNNCKIYTVDLFSWAVQIAKGMNYLTSRRVIHGDLAARNVLLTEKKIAKICDFGLAENMCQKDNYVKKKKGLVPIKWMAVESIRDGKFSIQSDVWSFGVFLWELFSLGVEPYSDIAVDKKFYRKLESGYKLSKPKYAHDNELYTLMQQCWEIVPEKRPSFLDLNIDLAQMLKALKNKINNSSENFQKQEKESNACANSYVLEKSKNEKGKISMEHPKPPEKNFKKTEKQVACPNDYVPMAKSSNCKNGKTQNSPVNLETQEKSSECFVRFEISNGNEYLKMNSATDAKLNRNPEDLQESFNKHGNEYLNMAKSNFVNNQNFQLDSKISQHGSLQESVNIHGIEYLDMRSNFKDSNSQNLQFDPEIRDKNPECLQDSIKIYGNEYLNMSKTNRTDVNYQNLNSTPNTLFDSEIQRSVQEPVNEFGNRYLDMKKSNVIGSTYQNLNSSPTQSLERNDYLTMNGNKT
ncbi:vascular endothelial growth factor receptor 1-like [Chrysoperla carnea]|uniref:vascular endothelial growth factor receptor 1-like n=1 Tax=Chrysoperla carnea TaxID=189513 RepID=UPI001D087DF8|nr:vascular endothelial growth factor receptor 1-like [Chrysoperla carnea]